MLSLVLFIAAVSVKTGEVLFDLMSISVQILGSNVMPQNVFTQLTNSFVNREPPMQIVVINGEEKAVHQVEDI